jgi:hypothetical protein
MKKIYLKILAFYLAAGVALSGYFYYYPIYYKINRKLEWFETTSYEVGNEYNIVVLVTIVGCLLIIGLGITTKKNE